MKILLIATAILTVVNAARYNIESESEELYDNINAKYLRGYLRQRQALNNLTEKVEAVCPGKGEDFEKALNKVKICADEIDETQETLCSVMRNHFLRCTRPMVKIFEDCFPEGSKDVPGMIFESLTSATQYICKTDGEHIFELMNGCVMKQNYRLSRCERKIRMKFQQFQRKIPSKSDICDFSQSFKPCLQGHLQLSCGHQITRDAVLGLYDALFAPCNSVTEANDMIEVLS